LAAVKRILYVDADREARLLMQDLLSPHAIDVAATNEEAHALARRHSYDLYVVSGGRPDSTSIELVAWLQRVDGRTPIVFCSSNGTARYQQAAVAAGAVRYFVKPLDPTLLRSTLTLLLKLAELESARAMANVQKTIQHELVESSPEARAAARAKAHHASESVLRAKAYRAFREAGGNRANFERLWPAAIDKIHGPEP
jgi:DNA-binding response OmpR family regulator